MNAEDKFDDLVQVLSEFHPKVIVEALAAAIDTAELELIAEELRELCEWDRGGSR